MNKTDNNITVKNNIDENGNGEFIVFDEKLQKIIEKTPYKNHKENGISIKYFYEKNGRIETPYVDGKVQGVVLYYSNDIIFREENYIDGKKEGITKDYKIVNGKAILWAETSYKNNLKDGLFIEYEDDGKTIKKKNTYLEGNICDN